MAGFNNDRAIYLQMADRLCDDILVGTYPEGERIPSVRDYAVSLEVNTNTAFKTYEYLAREEVIFNKRGMGYFVSPGAKEKIHAERRADFIKRVLPDIFRNMQMLGIPIAEVAQLFEKYQAEGAQAQEE